MSPVVQLQIRRMSQLMVDKGKTVGGVAELIIQGRLSPVAKEAAEWVKQAIIAIRHAEEPNPYRHWTDDQIAQHILDMIEQRNWKPL